MILAHGCMAQLVTDEQPEKSRLLMLARCPGCQSMAWMRLRSSVVAGCRADCPGLAWLADSMRPAARSWRLSCNRARSPGSCPQTSRKLVVYLSANLPESLSKSQAFILPLIHLCSNPHGLLHRCQILHEKYPPIRGHHVVY